MYICIYIYTHPLHPQAQPSSPIGPPKVISIDIYMYIFLFIYINWVVEVNLAPIWRGQSDNLARSPI